MKTGFLNATEIPMPADDAPRPECLTGDGTAVILEGDDVCHPQFGEGVVKAILPLDRAGGVIVEVDFIGAGVQRVSPHNLEIAWSSVHGSPLRPAPARPGVFEAA